MSKQIQVVRPRPAPRPEPAAPPATKKIIKTWWPDEKR
jgi:hypothetical protein